MPEGRGRSLPILAPIPVNEFHIMGDVVTL